MTVLAALLVLGLGVVCLCAWLLRSAAREWRAGIDELLDDDDIVEHTRPRASITVLDDYRERS